MKFIQEITFKTYLKTRARSAILFLGVGAALLTTQAKARDVAVTDYVIPKTLNQGSIGDCRMNDTKMLPTELSFRRAICLYHATPESAWDLDTVDEQLRVLQAAQTSGLPAAKQTYAVLLEGLYNCQKAKTVLKAMGGNLKQPEQRGLFCSARENGLTSMGQVNWSLARFGYENEGTHGLTWLMDQMEACYQEGQPFNSAWDDSCGIVQGPDAPTRLTAIQDTYAKVSNNYFGASGQITAMFVEKQEMSKRSLEDLSGKLAKLQARADHIARGLGSFQSTFGSSGGGESSIQQRLGTAMGQYQDAYGTAKAVLARYSEWSIGLLAEKNPDGSEVNFADLLTGGPDSAEARLKKRSDALQGPNGLMQAMESLGSRIRTLQDGKVDYRASAQMLCRVYYCHLATQTSDDNDLDNRTDNDSRYARACRSAKLFTIEKNPLCNKLNLPLKVDTITRSAHDFCAFHGFDVNTYGKVGMKDTTVGSCFKEGH